MAENDKETTTKREAPVGRTVLPQDRAAMEQRYPPNTKEIQQKRRKVSR